MTNGIKKHIVAKFWVTSLVYSQNIIGYASAGDNLPLRVDSPLAVNNEFYLRVTN